MRKSAKLTRYRREKVRMQQKVDAAFDRGVAEARRWTANEREAEKEKTDVKAREQVEHQRELEAVERLFRSHSQVTEALAQMFMSYKGHR
jgi:hypothetical protein